MNLCIADNLKLLRYKSGYSLEALAEIISVSRQSVAKWEAGDSVPDILNCVKLASLYRISLDELISKPLKCFVDNELLLDEGRMCGVIEVSADCTIRLPEAVMRLTDIQSGSKVLLMADEKRGIALIKCSQF